MIKILILLTLLSITLYTDIKDNKIKNIHLILPLVLGVLIAVLSNGLVGLKSSVFGIIIPFVALFLFFALKMLGAGDIKLFCTIGAIMGVNFVINNIIYSFFVAGIVVIGKLIFTGNLFKTLKSIYYFFKAIFIGRSLIEFPKVEANTFPFVIAIFIGTILQLIVNYRFI